MAVMVVNAGGMSLSGEGIPFLDSDDISSWASDAVQTAKEHGIIEGYPGNSFKPAGYATRAEAATIVWRLIGFDEGL